MTADEYERVARGRSDRALVRALTFHHAGVPNPESSRYVQRGRGQMRAAAVEGYTRELNRRFPGGVPSDVVARLVPDLRRP